MSGEEHLCLCPLLPMDHTHIQDENDGALVVVPESASCQSD
jgi:hypothetical protein